MKQVPRGSTIEDWPEERIWAELCLPLAKDGWRLTEGPIVGRSLLELYSYVVEPMQHGRLFLGGVPHGQFDPGHPTAPDS